MKVTSVYTTSTFKLILEFDNCEYRLLDIKRYLKNDKGKLLVDVRDDLYVFRTAEVENIAGTVCWINGVIFDPEQLYLKSINIDHILGESRGNK